MGYFYTEDSLEEEHYAGLPTKKLSNLKNRSNLDTKAPPAKRFSKGTNEHMAGLPSNYKSGFRSEKAAEPWNNNQRDLATPETIDISTKGGTTQFRGCALTDSLSHSDDNQAQQDIPNVRLGEYRRRLATPDEEKYKFHRTFVCTDPKTGRTEAMIARRPGAAHLDLNIHAFEDRALYTSQHRPKNEVLLAPKAALLSDPSTRTGKARVGSKETMVEMSDGYFTSKYHESQSLGFIRRKLNNDWSRSNKSTFDISEGYPTHHWNIKPVKPLINVIPVHEKH